MPEGCRLEEDLLEIIKAAAARADAGKPARVHRDDYVAGLGCLGGATDDPDVLGLRRRRRGNEAMKQMRERARSMMLARRWVVQPSSASIVSAGPGSADAH